MWVDLDVIIHLASNGTVGFSGQRIDRLEAAKILRLVADQLEGEGWLPANTPEGTEEMSGLDTPAG
jgi:hypothetical protein